MTRHQLLFLPKLTGTESLRAYMLRAAEQNMHPRIYQEELETLSKSSRFVWGMSQQDKDIARTLARRLAPISALGPKGLATMVLLGDDQIPVSCLHLRTRQVCPFCLADDRRSRLVWELKAARACAIHRSRLVRICPGCERSLQWGRSQLMHCFCGQGLSQIEPDRASTWEVKWARLLEAATTVSRFGRSSPRIASTSNVPTRLSKLLLMADVVRHVVLPVLYDSETSQDKVWKAITRTLNDPPYRDYLWDAIFLHAARDPLQLSRNLTPGRSKSEVDAAYLGILDDLAFPDFLRPPATDRCRRASWDKAMSVFDAQVHGVGVRHLQRAGWHDEVDPFDLADVNEDWHEAEVVQ